MSLRRARSRGPSVRLVVALVTLLGAANWGGPPGIGQRAVAAAPLAATPTPGPTPGPGDCGPNGTGCSGPAQVRCDFDDDGYGDLAVGVPGEDFGRGGVNVQYSLAGFLTTPAFIQGKFPGDNGVLAGSKFGAALACGDFNADGVSDLAVGGPNTRFGGDVWILWGQGGLGLDDDQYMVFHQNGNEMPGSAREGERFGFSLAVGDFNRDGVDDLAIGDPEEYNPGPKYATGTVVVIPGRKGGITFADVRQLWGWPIVRENEMHGQRFGYSLAAAPLVPGGGDDLAVGAPWTKVNDTASAGRVYVFRDHGGLTTHQAIDDVAIGVAGGLTPEQADLKQAEYFGWSLAAGDFNADSLVDLAIGIPYRTIPSGATSGVAAIVPGDGAGLNLKGRIVALQEAIGGLSESKDGYGLALAVGDWNVDGFDDLTVGAPFEVIGDEGGQPGVGPAGAVYVHYGGPFLLNAGGLTIRQGGGATPGTPEYHDMFGMSLAAVRLGSANLNYLVIGIPGERLVAVDIACSQGGAVQLAANWPGSGPATDDDFLLHQDTPAPYNVLDQRECSSATDPSGVTWAEPPRMGEFFGWAAGH